MANNLQIVAATLQKAQRSTQDPIALQAINLALGRIHSMAAVHRRLYDGAAYAQGLEPILCEVLAEAFRALPVDVRLDIRSEELSVSEMTAIALLVNEAAINAAKHVFRPRKGALFDVSMAEVNPGRKQLTIRDDGPGIPSEVAGPERQRFGLTVMRGLADQLGGSLELPQGSGEHVDGERQPWSLVHRLPCRFIDQENIDFCVVDLHDFERSRRHILAWHGLCGFDALRVFAL